MARGREHRTGIKITGDSSGGVRATKLARSELDKLSKAQYQHNTVAERGRKTFAAGSKAISGFALAAGAAVGLIGGLAKSVADKGDRIQKLSIQLGTTTEFISGMGHAAELSGASLEGFVTGFGKMQKSIADGVAGLTTAVRGFDALGLKAEELKRLKPEDQFLTIADRLGGLDDKTQRVAVAMDLFGRSGRELLPLFAQGGEGIQAMRDEAERLGLVMSQDLADASAQFNDDLTRLKGLGQGVRNQLAEGLLPQLTAVAQHFLEGAEAGDTWTKVGEVLGNTVRVLVAGFIALKETVILVGDAMLTAGGVLIDVVQALVTPFSESIGAISTSLQRLIEGDFKGAAAAFDGLGTNIKEKFVAEIKSAGDRMSEFGVRAKTRVSDAIDDVNDVLLRTPEIAQGAGDSFQDLGDDAEIMGKKAQDAAKSLQSIIDRLDPLGAMARRYSAEQEILNQAFADAGDDGLELAGWLAVLRAEYNKNRAAALGYGEAAEKAGQQGIDAAEKEAKARRDNLRKSQQDLETFATAFQRGVERLDDLFADLWRGIFDGSKNALDAIKSFFQNWLAEMAHAAITRPIVVSFTSAFSGSAAAGGGQGSGGLDSLFGLGGGGGQGFGGLSGLRTIFTGNSFGLGLANLPTWLGGTGGTALTAGQVGPVANSGGLFANAGNYANWQYGVAGILGYGAGKLIAPDTYAPSAASTGATLGMSIGGPWGALIGGILGLFAGSRFEHRFPTVGLSGENAIGFNLNDANITTPFGTISQGIGRGGVGNFWEAGSTGESIGQAIQEFDSGLYQLLSGFIDEEKMQLIKDRLAKWGGTWEEGAITLENILGSRFDTILSAFTLDIRGFVNEAEDLEGRAARLGQSLVATSLIEEFPDLFDGVTFDRFIEIAESMQFAGEDLGVTMERLVSATVLVTNQLQFLQEFVGQDLAQVFDDLISTQGQSLQDVAGGLVDHIVDLRTNFTGSAEDLQALTLAAANFTEIGLQFLNLIEQAKAGISAGTDRFAEQIQRDLLGDEAFYDHITTRAEELAKALRTMTDPAQITATQAEILRLSQQAYGLLTPEQRATQGQGFLDFIRGVEADSIEQLTEARENFLDDSEFVKGLIDKLVDEFEDPLTIVANEHQAAADMHSEAAGTLNTAGETLIEAGEGLGSLPGIIKAGLQEFNLNADSNGVAVVGAPVLTSNTAAAPTAGSPAGAGGYASQVPIGEALQQVGAVVARALDVYGNKQVAALLASDRNMKVSVRAPAATRRGIQTR